MVTVCKITTTPFLSKQDKQSPCLLAGLSRQPASCGLPWTGRGLVVGYSTGCTVLSRDLFNNVSGENKTAIKSMLRMGVHATLACAQSLIACTPTPNIAF